MELDEQLLYVLRRRSDAGCRSGKPETIKREYLDLE